MRSAIDNIQFLLNSEVTYFPDYLDELLCFEKKKIILEEPCLKCDKESVETPPVNVQLLMFFKLS